MPGLVPPTVRPLNCAGPDEDHRGRRTALDEYLTARLESSRDGTVTFDT
jgi:hypothetical protein